MKGESPTKLYSQKNIYEVYQKVFQSERSNKFSWNFLSKFRDTLLFQTFS